VAAAAVTAAAAVAAGVVGSGRRLTLAYVEADE
jgi:hypothetical protein